MNLRVREVEGADGGSGRCRCGSGTSGDSGSGLGVGLRLQRYEMSGSGLADETRQYKTWQDKTIHDETNYQRSL